MWFIFKRTGEREADQKQQTHIWQQTEVKKSTEDQQRQMNRTGQVTSVSMFFMLAFSQLEWSKGATNMGKSTYNRVLIHQISYARVLDIQGKVEERSCATGSGILIEYKTDPDFVPVSLQWWDCLPFRAVPCHSKSRHLKINERKDWNQTAAYRVNKNPTETLWWLSLDTISNCAANYYYY